jgi:hypothetical protein
MTSEQKFNRWIADTFHGAHVQRIENTTTNGVPDFNMCLNGREIWVEAKVLYPKGILLRKEQYAWAVSRSECGGRVFVLTWDEAHNTVIVHSIWKFTKVVPSGDGKTVVIQSPCDGVFSKHHFTTRAELLRILFRNDTI